MMNDRQFSLHSCESSVQMEALRLAWTNHHIFCSAQSFYVTDAILHKEVTSHERARAGDFIAASRTLPWLPSG